MNAVASGPNFEMVCIPRLLKNRTNPTTSAQTSTVFSSTVSFCFSGHLTLSWQLLGRNESVSRTADIGFVLLRVTKQTNHYNRVFALGQFSNPSPITDYQHKLRFMTESLFDIPELQGLQFDQGMVRIPCEQNVPFSPRIQSIVDTPQFQRLRRISQLGLVSRVYPGATHSRFEHALGVYHNAIRYLMQLGKDERFRSIINRRNAERLLVAALLHDIGHWPFCHPIEDMHLDGFPSHEEYAREFLSPETEIGEVLNNDWGFQSDEIVEILVGTAESPQLRLLQSILSGPIDVDKMDYLDRDSLHAGVPYGRNFDRSRLIQSLILNEAGDGLAITAKGKTAAELMVFARYVMFSEVYWHHAVRSATTMFARCFYEVFEQIDLKSMFRADDEDAMILVRTAAEKIGLRSLADGLLGNNRQLYKRVAEYPHDFNPEQYERLAHLPYHEVLSISNELSSAVGRQLNIEIESTDLLIDAPPLKREVEFKIDVYYPKENVYRPLQNISPVVDALARKQFDDYVKKVRVFCHPRLADAIQERVKIDRILLDVSSAA